MISWTDRRWAIRTTETAMREHDLAFRPIGTPSKHLAKIPTKWEGDYLKWVAASNLCSMVVDVDDDYPKIVRTATYSNNVLVRMLTAEWETQLVNPTQIFLNIYAEKIQYISERKS